MLEDCRSCTSYHPRQWPLLMKILILAFMFLCNDVVSGEDGSGVASTSMRRLLSVWEEVPFDDEASQAIKQHQHQQQQKNKPPRQRWISFRSLNSMYQQEQEDDGQEQKRRHHNDDDDDDASEEEPHPLRTDEWQIQIKWKRRILQNGWQQERVEPVLLEFDSDGFVRSSRNITVVGPAVDPTVDTDASSCNDGTNGGDTKQNFHQEQQQQQQQQQRVLTTSVVGTWKMSPSGIGWNFPTSFLPLSLCSSSYSSPSLSPSSSYYYLDDYYFQFHAKFHPNPFGAKPKMICGIITQCRRRDGNTSRQGSLPWSGVGLRPVVGTFEGRGVGADLYDVSFTKRGMGLPKERVVPTES